MKPRWSFLWTFLCWCIVGIKLQLPAEEPHTRPHKRATSYHLALSACVYMRGSCTPLGTLGTPGSILRMYSCSHVAYTIGHKHVVFSLCRRVVRARAAMARVHFHTPEHRIRMNVSNARARFNLSFQPDLFWHT